MTLAPSLFPSPVFLLVREMQGMRNGMTPRTTIQLVVSFKGTPRFIPSFHLGKSSLVEKSAKLGLFGSIPSGSERMNLDDIAGSGGVASLLDQEL